AEGADVGGPHDLEAPLPGGVGQEPVGRVDEPVGVKSSGDGQVDGYDQHRREQRGEGLVGEPPDAADEGADRGADDGKPTEGPRGGRGRPADDGEEREGLAHQGPSRAPAAVSRGTTRPATQSSTRSAIAATAVFSAPSVSANRRPD